LIGVAALVYWSVSSWLDKPYTNIEHQDKDTIRGQKPVWLYAFSKLYSQRRTLEGVQDYAMYVYVHSRHGIQWVFVSIDGVRMNLYVPYGSYSFTTEVVGVKTLGTHAYVLDSLDLEGNRGHSQCYLTLTAGKEGNS
jgi:hypothetical protein